MKKINIVKKNEDFRRIITTGKYKKGELFNIYIERTNENIYYIGTYQSRTAVAIGKRISHSN